LPIGLSIVAAAVDGQLVLWHTETFELHPRFKLLHRHVWSEVPVVPQDGRNHRFEEISRKGL